MSSKGPLKFKIEVSKSHGGFALWLYEAHSVYLDGRIFWSMVDMEWVSKDHGFFYERAIKKLKKLARKRSDNRNYDSKVIEFSF